MLDIPIVVVPSSRNNDSNLIEAERGWACRYESRPRDERRVTCDQVEGRGRHPTVLW